MDERSAQVVVVGAGPMGIVLSLELAGAGISVLLVESGADRHDPETQRLGDFSSGASDPFHASADLTTRRQLGGATALWGGRCVPFDPIDFAARPFMPDTLWPVTYAEIEPFLERACRWAVCGSAVFNARRLPELADKMLVPGLPDGDVRTTDLERWSLPTRFGQVYGAALSSHPNIQLATGLTCVEVVPDPSGKKVDHLELRTAEGSKVIARGTHYVLAAGGLETTRLLLASRQASPEGIGNHSGHLGRWYMSHVEARIAEVQLTTPVDETIYSHERDAEGVYVRRRFTFSEEFQRSRAMPNAAVWFVNPNFSDDRHGSGILSGVYLTLKSPLGRFLLADAIRRVGIRQYGPTSIRAHLRNIVRDLMPAVGFAVSFTYARFFRRGRKAPGFFVKSGSNTYPLHYHGEHRPHWESRVTLQDETDELGLPRLRTHIHFSQEDIESVKAAHERIDAHLQEHRVGSLRYLEDDPSEAVRQYLKEMAGFHQTGTTRMSREPADGVVDSDLAVHGFEDLSVASTSVFPTSGQANPTLMGIAFGVRLADHLRSKLS